MGKSLPYEHSTAGTNAFREIEKILNAFGCQNFGTMQDNEAGDVLVAFKYRDRQVQMRASWKGYANAWLKSNPWSSSRTRVGRVEYERRAVEQAKISVCSILRDRIKGAVTAVECGIASFEEVFLANILLPSGETMIQNIEKHKLLPLATPEQVTAIGGV